MLPVLLQIGPVKIYAMGVMLALGMLLSLYWWWKMGRDEHWEEIALFDAFFLSVLAFFLAGRLGYVMFALDSATIAEKLALLARPGLHYLSGILAGTVIVSMIARAKEWEIWKVWDSLAVSLSLALICGSIGVLLNRGELVLDIWGIVIAIVSFVLTTMVRKNFRFYSWYKANASVAKDGLAALIWLALVGVYYLGRAVITTQWYLLGVGTGFVLVAGWIVGLRVGREGKKFSLPRVDFGKLRRTTKRRRQR